MEGFSNAVRLLEFWPRKIAVHTYLGGLKPYAKTAFALELSKAITFGLRSYPGEISHSNSPNRELSNDLSDVVMRRREVVLHTSSHLTPTEA